MNKTFWEKVRDINDRGLTKLWIVLSSTFCVIATVTALILDSGDPDSCSAAFFLSGPCLFFGLWALGKGVKWVAKEFTTNDRKK